MSKNFLTTVELQEDLGGDQYVMRLHGPELAAEVRAGQFVMIGLPEIRDQLVRRPFSVARVHHDAEGRPCSFDVVYKVIGQYTGVFSQLRAGATMTVLGPLGRGFWLPEGSGDGLELLLVAGGIGNAPFPLLLQELGERAKRATLFYGGRSKQDLTLVDWFREHCGEVQLATEDGSVGHEGFVTGPLIERLDDGKAHPRVVMACGPTPMLRAVGDLSVERDVPCQLALEETMACGFGVCLGCVVPKREPANDFDTYVRVCSEGPVFDAREIRL